MAYKQLIAFEMIWRFSQGLIIVIFTVLAGCTSKAYLLNREGIDLAEQGQYESAIEKFEAAIEEDPKTPVAYLNLARTYLIMEKPNLAVEPAEMAVHLGSDNLEALLLLAMAYAMLKDENALKQITEKLKKEQGETTFLYLVLGEIAFDSGQWEAAIAHYHKAAALTPQSDLAYLQLGKALLSREIERVQNQELPAALAMEDPGSMVYMANLVACGGLDLDEAMASFRKAVYLNPQNLEAHIMLGFLSDRRAEYDQAALEWEECLRLDPYNSYLHIAMGRNAQYRKDYEKAAHYFAKARELSPHSPQPVISEILLAVERGEYSRAVQKSLEVKADLPEVERNLFQIFALDKATHVPWLISMVANEDPTIADFSARALAFLSGQPFTLDKSYWQSWWKQEKP